MEQQGQQIIEQIEEFIHSIETNNLTNEQFFLDFLDQINELSIRY